MKSISIYFFALILFLSSFINISYAFEGETIQTEQEINSKQGFTEKAQITSLSEKLNNSKLFKKRLNRKKSIHAFIKRVLNVVDVFFKILFKLYIIPFLVSLFFLVIKLSGTLAWSWIWVFSPLWIATLLYFILFILLILIIRNNF